MHTLNKLVRDMVRDSYTLVANRRKSEKMIEMSLLVRFKNYSNRTVDVIWLDFNGARVFYRTLLPNQFFDSRTVLNHQWIAVDHYDNSIQMYLMNLPVFVIDKTRFIQSLLNFTGEVQRAFLFNFPGIQIPITEKVASLQQITERFLGNYISELGMTFNDLSARLNPLDVPKSLIEGAHIRQCFFQSHQNLSTSKWFRCNFSD